MTPGVRSVVCPTLPAAHVVYWKVAISQSWLIGTFRLIYKNKGTPYKFENCPPKTNLSCFGKLFTAVLNNRLTKFTEDFFIIISEVQAGFRKGYSTGDNIFILNGITDIL